jgi:hypothetical protein
MDETGKTPAPADGIYGFLELPIIFWEPVNSADIELNRKKLGGDKPVIDNLMYYPANESPIEVIPKAKAEDAFMWMLYSAYEDKKNGSIYLCIGGTDRIRGTFIQKLMNNQTKTYPLFSEAHGSIESVVRHNGILYDYGPTYGLRESETGKTLISVYDFREYLFDPSWGGLFSTGKNLYFASFTLFNHFFALKKIEERSPDKFVLRDLVYETKRFKCYEVLDYNKKVFPVFSNPLQMGERIIRNKSNGKKINGDKPKVVSRSENSAGIVYYDRGKKVICTAELNLEERTLDAIKEIAEVPKLNGSILPITTAAADAFLREMGAKTKYQKKPHFKTEKPHFKTEK